jgi:hypothetical protein
MIDKPMRDILPYAFGTNSSVVVTSCQICQNKKLHSILFLGYMPPVNTMPKIGSKPHEQPSYPAELLYCKKCDLVQIGLIVDPKILFSSEYPYTSSTTKVLRDNFSELYEESSKLIGLQKEDLVIDIGSNDGNLLKNFKDNHKVLGITPEDIGNLAIKAGIPTILDYFNDKTVKKVKAKYGKAKLITATNVFAHMEKIHEVTANIISLLDKDGVFINESHYLLPLINTVQYDTIYHEHQRYYSLHSLNNLFKMHGLEIFHAKEIPSHGGSIRVYAARKGVYPIQKSVAQLMKKEKPVVTSLKAFADFKENVMLSKLHLYQLLSKIKTKGEKIYGISAPSRGTTLINYLGLDEGVIDCVVEIKGSYKIGLYIPGTLIPVLNEDELYKKQPEYAFLLSWHIADELIPKLRKKGFKGKFIVPLPTPRIVA